MEAALSISRLARLMNESAVLAVTAEQEETVLTAQPTTPCSVLQKGFKPTRHWFCFVFWLLLFFVCVCTGTHEERPCTAMSDRYDVRPW